MKDDKLKGFIAGYVCMAEILYKEMTGENPDLEWVQAAAKKARAYYGDWTKVQDKAEKSA